MTVSAKVVSFSTIYLENEIDSVGNEHRILYN